MILGITGGTGSGKSVASEFFKNNGFYIMDFDKISRIVTCANSPCLKELTKIFGNDILDADGNLIRRKLGSIVFKSPKKLGILNEITHKYILKYAFDDLKKHTGEDIVFDAPLLFEAQLDKYCQKTLAVICDTNLRVQRIKQRDNLTEQAAFDRILSQPENKYYIQKSDYTVLNNGNIAEFLKELNNVLKQIKGE